MRIGIVNDLGLAVEAVRRVVTANLEHEVAWIAQDGSEAVRRCAADRPDVVLMDLIMPGMDGVEATRRIMAQCPCAVVVVTADVDRNCSRVFEAMGAGALDAVNTPVLDGSPAQAQPLLKKLATIGKLIRPGPIQVATPTSRERISVGHTTHDTLVAIGASAGGPAALAKVLARLPEDFPASVLVVQHVDGHFARGLVEWLDFQCLLEVRLARQGDRPRPGKVLFAGTDHHLVLSNSERLGYTPEPSDCSYRPSVDVLFRSVAQHWPGEVIAILLTGMGRDGAEGLKVLRDQGHHTIAQDERTSAVYGMPKAAVELRAATEVLPLEDIGPRLIGLIAQKMKLHG